MCHSFATSADETEIALICQGTGNHTGHNLPQKAPQAFAQAVVDAAAN